METPNRLLAAFYLRMIAGKIQKVFAGYTEIRVDEFDRKVEEVVASIGTYPACFGDIIIERAPMFRDDSRTCVSVYFSNVMREDDNEKSNKRLS
jgi:hypothetical protein